MLKILDLFCGAGGAAMGLAQACREAKIDFEILGIDISLQPEYPFVFLRGDFETILPQTLAMFDFIWASPPCQAFSQATPDKARHKNYIPQVRDALKKSGKPFVMENVQLAPLRHDLFLCGEMFGLRVIRHRFFEIEGFIVPLIEHPAHNGYSRRWPGGGWRSVGEFYYETVAGNGCGKDVVATWQKAMGIEHITKRRGLAQAVPPSYSKYIMANFLQRIKS